MDIDDTAENTFECITWRAYVCDVSAFFLYFHYPHFCVQTHKFSQDVPFMGPYVRHTIKWSGTCICWFAPIYLSLSVNEFMFMYKHTYCSVESLVPIPFGSKGNLPCLHNNMLLFTPWTASFLVGSLKDVCDDRWGTWWALQYKLNTFSNVSGTTGYKLRIVWIHLERQLLKPTWGMFSILPRSF